MTVSHKFEQARGHVASAVECYMAQFGATGEEAINEFRKQVIDAWKDINKECLPLPSYCPHASFDANSQPFTCDGCRV